ncbi:hypothetical protein E1287_21635 [Actinomadura sp. KC06]|uniref:hypothetical protein n=1 Tax=Actinomadura sp. KC06 TaxID=2530369 RepID=UPI001042BBA8|nr:hypothetical protein [Actinomadura sp. KC06]TDD32716.1 hypothetical protein E1287_21635 [Actinomadura sp. KC06]
MILTQRITDGVAAGDVTVAYRRWKRPRVKPGSTFRGDDTDPLWRVTLSWAGSDPRQTLAEDAALSPSDISDIDTLLDRLDARTPWARTTLSRIARQPGITAAKLAATLPTDKDSHKRRIRILKEHGLTRSLPTGYELSVRGHAYLSATNPGRPPSSARRYAP